jgi:glycerol-3-phosphate acyltransferase PlsY
MTWHAVLTIAVALSYLLGSVPFGLVLGKLKGIDIRHAGSKNIGATNLTRLAGRPWGIAAFVLDFVKGLGPVVGAAWLWPRFGDTSAFSTTHTQICVGLAAIIGHVFPVYLRFRGGKGVATTFGVMTGLLWLSAAIAGASWGVFYLVTRTVSIASIAAAVAFPVAVFFLKRGDPEFIAVLSLAMVLSVLILVRHRANIRRLLSGKEHRF